MSAKDKVEEIVKGNDVVLFMKGNPMFPQCGFSARATGILQQCGVKFAHVNVLAHPAALREGRVRRRFGHHDGDVRVRRVAEAGLGLLIPRSRAILRPW
jgi:hypothetical protein